MLPTTDSIPKPKERALHVLVPEEAHLRARMAAVISRVPFKHFMAQLMMSAMPIEAKPMSAVSINDANVPLAPKPLGATQDDAPKERDPGVALGEAQKAGASE